MKNVGKILKTYIFLIVFTLLLFPLYSFAESSNYFNFDKAKEIEFKGNVDLNKIQKNLKVKDKSGKEYDVIINTLGKNKIVISPIERVKGTVRFSMTGLNYVIRDYEKPLYIDNEENLEKLANYSMNKIHMPYLKMETVDGMMMEDKNTEEDFSKTNTEEENVDEGDNVKQDSKYIYIVRNENQVDIFSKAESKVIGKISVKKQGNYINEKIYETYIDNDRVYIISGSENYLTQREEYDYRIMPYSNVETYLEIYNIKNPKKPYLEKSFTFKGVFENSRKIGNDVYIVTLSPLDKKYEKNEKLSIVKKAYPRDEKFKYVMNDDVRNCLYFPFTPSEYIVKVNKVNSSAGESNKALKFMSDYGDIYMSEKNMYIQSVGSNFLGENIGFSEETTIRKYNLNDFNYIGSCTVDGTTIGKYAIREVKGRLFVCFTKGQYSNNSSNAIASFNEKLEKLDEINNIAKGEKIYSVRFKEDVAYFVTFKQVDPLFAVSIKKPEKLSILGYLKIPGYSKYLHPFKDNLLLGIGYDTKTIKNKFSPNDIVTNSGVKLSLFKDENGNIKELKSITIGAEGTTTPIMYNPKDLMIDKNRNIIAFPIIVTRSIGKTNFDYDKVEIAFRGVYVYKVLDNDLKLIGRITHLSPDEFANINYETISQREIYKVLESDGKLYTISAGGIKINDVNTLKEIKSVYFN